MCGVGYVGGARVMSGRFSRVTRKWGNHLGPVSEERRVKKSCQKDLRC